jgi:2'-5' RNA ligase
MRLFLAIPAPPHVQAHASLLVEELRGAGDVRWIRPELLHLTLKFFGEVPEERAEELVKTFSGLANTGANFVLECGGIGAFPTLRRARTIWLSIGGKGAARLAALAERIESTAETLGFKREERRFQPHLTLGRVRGPRGLPELSRRLERLTAAETEPIPWPVRSFHLIRSELKPAGPIYTSLQEIELK